MDYEPIDIKNIIKDVKDRLALIQRLKINKLDLSDSEWDRLVFYLDYHKDHLEEFKNALPEILETNDENLINGLKDHGICLSYIYTGRKLTKEICRLGSRYHGLIFDLYPNYKPEYFLSDFKELKEMVEDLKKRNGPEYAQVIENIAIDEVIEWTGRNLAKAEEKKRKR